MTQEEAVAHGRYPSLLLTALLGYGSLLCDDDDEICSCLLSAAVRIGRLTSNVLCILLVNRVTSGPSLIGPLPEVVQRQVRINTGLLSYGPATRPTR